MRWAEAGDCEFFAPGTSTFTMRAVVATFDGIPKAICGLQFHPNGEAIAFTEGRDAIQHRPSTVAKMARFMMKIIVEADRPIYAIESRAIPGAPRFLKWCGFQYLGTTDQGEIYQWKP